MNIRSRRGSLQRTARGKANETLLRIESDIGDYEGRCLFAVDEDGSYCNEKVTNNCHVVSEPNVLRKLREHGSQEVLELQWNVSKWRELVFSGDVEKRAMNPDTYEPSRKPTHDSCVGWFACKTKAHDDKFHCIDMAEPDFKDSLVCLLSAYRLVLYRTDQYRQALELYHQWNEDVLEGPRPEGIPLWLQQKDQIERGLWASEKVVALLGRNWYAREHGGTFDADPVSARVLDFRSKLRLAGGVFYDRYVLAIVFPTESDWHKMALVYLTSEADLAEKEIERLARVAGVSESRDNYGVIVTRELMTNGWSVLAASERSYNELSNKDRSTINGLVARQAQRGAASRATRRQFQRSNRSRSR